MALSANDRRIAAAASKAQDAGTKITKDDLDFLNLIHTVGVDTDVMRPHASTLIFTAVGRGKGKVSFKSVSEFKSYVGAWREIEAIYNRSTGKPLPFFDVMKLLRRKLRRWCKSFTITAPVTSADAKDDYRDASKIITFVFKGGDSDTRIVLPGAQSISCYCRVLDKLLKQYQNS